MEYTEAKESFIREWSVLGTFWGINRTMASIHALLLISSKPLTTDEIIKELNTSLGNTNINLRQLLDIGLLKKVHKSGERKEYYEALKDIHKVAVLILKERRKRELEPLIKLLDNYKTININKKEKDELEFMETLTNISSFSKKVDKIFESAIKSDESMVWKVLVKFLN